MRTLIDQIECSLDSQMYYLSLFAALAMPDIAGALDSGNGLATGQKYARWYEAWVRPRSGDVVREKLPENMRSALASYQSPMTGEACYRFRCSLLHQGTSYHPQSPFQRIAFLEPRATTLTFHYTFVRDVLLIDLGLFCREVCAGARLWLNAVETTDRFKSNYEKFARLHPEGLPNVIKGIPVVG